MAPTNSNHIISCRRSWPSLHLVLFLLAFSGRMPTNKDGNYELFTHNDASDMRSEVFHIGHQQFNMPLSVSGAAYAPLESNSPRKNITSASCGIEPATTYAYIPITLTFIALAAVTGGVRLLSRLAFGLKLWWDDWMSFTALAACIGYTATMVACKSKGFGMDIWAVSFDEIPFLLRVNYVMNVLYVFTRMLIRISIVLFYMRIFQFDSAKRVMRIAMAVAIIVSMPAIFGSMFLCTPISYYWMRWDGGCG
ncbi:unnamed protein product, partial [Clonostachys rosea f. rosea IK726]